MNPFFFFKLYRYLNKGKAPTGTRKTQPKTNGDSNNNNKTNAITPTNEIRILTVLNFIS